MTESPKRPHVIVEIEQFDPAHSGPSSEQVLQQLHGLSSPVVCFIKAGETSYAQTWLDQFACFVGQLRSARPDVTIHLTASVFHGDQEQKLREISDSVLFVIADLVRPYYNLVIEPRCAMSQQWNSQAENFLLLMGKPHRFHRIGLLYNLDQAGLLTQCVWSLHMTDTVKAQCVQILNSLGCEDPESWIHDHLRNPDNISPVLTTTGNLHYTGVPFSTKLYDHAKFQIVSETDWLKQPPWITEKTMLAVANRNPFILAAVPGTPALMRQLGFKTFEKYCLHADYDQEPDSMMRMKKIIDNAGHWLQNIHQYHDAIQQDIESNHARFMQLGRRYLDDAKVAVDQLNIDCDAHDILPVFDPISDFSHPGFKNWTEWYNYIREPHWPDCHRESDFAQLPVWIQQECIEVFGYKPWEIK